VCSALRSRSYRAESLSQSQAVASGRSEHHHLIEHPFQAAAVFPPRTLGQRSVAAGQHDGTQQHRLHARAPRVMVTDKLASYGAAKREVMPSVEHRKHKGLNNRADNSHQPTRRRERQIKCFKSAGQAQRLLSAHDGINNLFHLRRHQVPATQYRAARTKAFQIWTELTGVTAAA